MASKKNFAIGTVCLDRVLTISGSLNVGEKHQVLCNKVFIGGQGYRAIYTASCLGSSFEFVSVFAGDAQRAVSELEANGSFATYSLTSDEAPSQATIVISNDCDDVRTVFSQPSPELIAHSLSKSDIERISRESNILFCDGAQNINLQIDIASASSGCVVVDLEVDTDETRKLATHADIVTCSSSYLEQRFGEITIPALRVIEQEGRGNNTIAGFTDGAQGSIFVQGDISIFTPSFSRVKEIDGTGCGDAYRGGFLHGLNSPQFSLPQAIALGSSCGSCAVEVLGFPKFDKVEIETVFARYQQIILKQKINTL